MASSLLLLTTQMLMESAPTPLVSIDVEID